MKTEESRSPAQNVAKLVEQGLLYDFYGELLTEHQKEIYEDLVYNDLSLNEIADEYGISKQGVHDLIKRCTRTMQGYEDKLHMISRYVSIKNSAQEIVKVIQEEDVPAAARIQQLCGSIIEELG